ncbi:synaptic vesicle glycoprotein 2B-like [Babylonia areolata]|uniref:synaptic vesicle glycoprotein 2B-like n=1 Tax=Babylonia areolata TaxID=304850 RepID=UPI003FD5F5BC
MDETWADRSQRTQEEYCQDFEPDLEDGLLDNEETKLLPEIKIRTSASPSRDQDCGRGGVFTYEESLTAVGVGKFHVLLLLLCGWAVSSDAVEILSVSFLLPSATCELHLTSQDKGLLNAIVFVGMMIGGYFWGSLADRWGRRSILIWSLAVNGVGGLLSSVSQVFWLFLLFRLFSGIGVGGSIPVIFTYFTEFQSRVRRGSMISVLATFWMAGNIVAAGLAWLVIPHKSLGYVSSDFTYDSWRIFVALCTLPSLTSAAIFVLMPESPKFLLKMGRDDQAISVLKKVHRSNKSRSHFEISRLVIASDKSDRGVTSPVGVETSEELKRETSCCRSMLDNVLQLFRPPLLSTTCVLLVTNFAIAFGYYGLFMWFPELFNRIDKNGGTVCEPGHSNSSDKQNSSSVECTEVGEVVYLEGFLTALSNLPGNLLTIACMDRLGRKFLLAGSMVVSGLSVFLLWWVHQRWQNIAMSCLFGAVSTIGFNALDVLQTELFPTNVRSTAFGIQTGTARIAAIAGNLTFGLLVDVHCSIPMILVAALMSFGGLVSLRLPNTVGTDIH